jgi:hypothetical protein
LFSDTSAAARHVREHEAGVDAAVLDQERGQADIVRIGEERDAPLRERADLGDREGEVVGRERDRLRVEVAAGQHRVVVGEHERVVRHAVGFRHEHRRAVPHRVEARAHDLRLAAQAVGVLHALALRVRRADRAAGQQRAVRRGSVAGRGARASAWMRASNGTSLPRHASTDSAPATNAAPSRAPRRTGRRAPARSTPACR